MVGNSTVVYFLMIALEPEFKFISGGSPTTFDDFGDLTTETCGRVARCDRHANKTKGSRLTRLDLFSLTLDTRVGHRGRRPGRRRGEGAAAQPPPKSRSSTEKAGDLWY